MATNILIDTIQLKRSFTPGHRPPTLLAGEEFINFGEAIRLIGTGADVAGLPPYPLAPVTPIGPLTNVTRSVFGAITVPVGTNRLVMGGFYLSGDRGGGAPYVAGSTVMPISDATGRSFGIDCSGTVDVGWFGAKGDTTTDDSAAFQAAGIAAMSVRIGPGTFNVSSFTPADGCQVVGSGKGVTNLRTMTRCLFVIRLGAGCSLEDISVNSNNLADRGVSMKGPYVYMRNVHSHFASVHDGVYGSGAGFFNEATSVTFKMSYCSTDSNWFGFFSAGGFNNTTIDNFFSQGGDQYGMYVTYADGLNPNLDQPQAVRITNSTFISNNYGIWVEKNVFDWAMSNVVVDVVGFQGIRFGEDNANIKIGPACFLGSGPNTPAIMIGAGSNDVEIFSNAGIGNCYYAVQVLATTTKRCKGIKIHNNTIGPAKYNVVLIDSPDAATAVYDNIFSGYRETASAQILATATFADTTQLGTIKVYGNTFLNPSLCVDPLLTRCRDNVGWKTFAEVPFGLPAGNTTVSVPHGLVRTPIDAYARIPAALQVCVDGSDASTSQVRVDVSTGSNRSGYLTVRCD